MHEKETVRISKFLSLVLRHRPELLGILLDEQGWADVRLLLQKMTAKGFPITMEKLEQVVATNNKNRFAFNADKTRIRANQGHSVPVDLQYSPHKPPQVLYHGTSEKVIPAILNEGLKKGKRHHVHLSPDQQTAINVGQRHGKPVVLQIAALKMYEAGHEFFCTPNGVWLTDAVPPGFLHVIM